MPFGLYLRAHAQPVINLGFHFVLTWAWNKFLLFYIRIGKAYDFAFGNVVLSVAQLGLAPGGVSVVVTLCWLGFVFNNLVQALVC